MQDFEEGEVLFREPPLVGALHTASRRRALTCGHCFRHVGSVEQQIVRAVLAAVADAQDNDYEKPEGGGIKGDSSVPPKVEQLDVGGSNGVIHGTNSGQPDAENGNDLAPGSGLDAAFLWRLLDGSEKLPHSERFPLPAAVSCHGGCDNEVYCSAACAAAAWERHHQLLCTGPAAPKDAVAEAETDGTPGSSGDKPRRKRSRHAVTAVSEQPAQHSANRSGCQTKEGQNDDEQRRESAPADVGSRRDALVEVQAHADATNDIFHVAARLVAGVLIRAAALSDARAASGPRQRTTSADRWTGEQPRDTRELSSASAVAGTVDHGTPDVTAGEAAALSSDACWSALQRAWEPHAVAWKAVWWEAVALPPDVTEETAFRQGKPSVTF